MNFKSDFILVKLVELLQQKTERGKYTGAEQPKSLTAAV